MKYLILLSLMLVSIGNLFAQVPQVDYDIIYVRYPLGDQSDPNNPTFLAMPQGEKAYAIDAGADLVLLKPDGTEEILVDCGTTCSVYDPFISYDATTVYYTLIDQFDEFPQSANALTRGLLYKIHLDEQPYTPIQLTFDESFESDKYAGNSSGGDFLADAHRNMRDMAPVPLEDGRILFTSNRSAFVGYNSLADEIGRGSVQELWVMDDHEGELNTAELANMRKLDMGTLHMVQHPLQLKDGRIAFTTWQDAGTRYQYSMSPIFTIHPDGTNLQQFTEPHWRQKWLEHFLTQLPNEDVVWALYYPSFDYGFGVIQKAPIGTGNKNSPPDYLSGSVKQRWTHNGNLISKRGFDRKGTIVLTPHTSPADAPAPNESGKYSYPSVAPNGNLLVAYSTGYVNFFNSACNPDQCDALASGIYMIPNAMNNIITDPNQLIKIKDDLAYNEIFARAVVPYQSIYGIPKPNHIPWDRSNTNGPTAIVGTSSMINRESAPIGDSFFQANGETNGRENVQSTNWIIQGADAGIYNDDEIWGVRIVKTPHKPFTKPINKSQDTARFNEVVPYHTNSVTTDIIARYGAIHDERWEIIGEFPLAHTASTDAQGNRDTSWKALIPADTPTFIQAINNRGMTLNSELTWRGLKAGEKRVDCGGCHMHSGEGLSYATTQSGQDAPIQNITGITNNDPRIQDSIWDLTTGSIPVLVDEGTTGFISQRALDVEFYRDIEPIITTGCAGCHDGVTQTPDLSMTGGDLWLELTRANGYNDIVQQSLYVRAQQSRASLLTWIMYNERLDGRTNDTWNDDYDYPENHPTMNFTMAQKLQVSRWIDLGNPTNFPNETSGFEYTADATLPVVTEVFPMSTSFNNHYHVGIIDADSGINWSTLLVEYYTVSAPQTVQTITIDQSVLLDDFDVLNIPYSSVNLTVGTEYVLRISVDDNTGNTNTHAVRLTKE